MIRSDLPTLPYPRSHAGNPSWCVCCGYRVWALRRVCQLCPRVPHNNCQQIYEHDDDYKSVRPQLKLRFRIINIVAGIETSLSLYFELKFKSVFVLYFFYFCFNFKLNFACIETIDKAFNRRAAFDDDHDHSDDRGC